MCDTWINQNTSNSTKDRNRTNDQIRGLRLLSSDVHHLTAATSSLRLLLALLQLLLALLRLLELSLVLLLMLRLLGWRVIGNNLCSAGFALCPAALTTPLAAPANVAATVTTGNAAYPLERTTSSTSRSGQCRLSPKKKKKKIRSLDCPKDAEAEVEETSPEALCGPQVMLLQLEYAAVPLVVPLAELVLAVGSLVAAPLLPSLQTAVLLPTSSGTAKVPGTSSSTTAPKPLAGAGVETTIAAVLPVATGHPAAKEHLVGRTVEAEHPPARARLQPTRPVRHPDALSTLEPVCIYVEA
ncbi:hypothetical protein Taro_033829 [Colocasia esculenta]|uniref:Uncharacterized protein n=1 Tax=Colocasia esculenta TaxID=4460 RepID=A0A843VPR5_COLES|nr:hypothetical protein [Colocasia esculenta]